VTGGTKQAETSAKRGPLQGLKRTAWVFKCEIHGALLASERRGVVLLIAI
jgi:hypothetical protein